MRAISSSLWSRGITHLDAVIISHADADHYNALPELLERFSVGVVYVSPVMFDEPTDALDRLHSSIVAAGVPIRELWQGATLANRGGATIEVVHPPRTGVLGSDNANSLVLAVEYAGRRMLLPGDLESPGLDDVMAELPYDCDVLLAPHHGSRRSDPPGFAAWCTPEWVVISGGSDADPDVRRTYEQADARVFNTGQDGAVEISVDRGQIRATTWLANRGYLPWQADDQPDRMMPPK